MEMFDGLFVRELFLYCISIMHPAYATLCGAHNRNDAAVVQFASKENV
jgi:hypothetical protein